MRPSYYIYPGLKQHLLTTKELSSIRGKRKESASLNLIFLEVCNHFQLHPSKVNAKSRQRELVWARHLYCWLARKLTSLPLIEIGQVIGGRDHTTVISGSKRAAGLIECYSDLAKDARILETIITDKLYVENKTVKDFIE